MVDTSLSDPNGMTDSVLFRFGLQAEMEEILEVFTAEKTIHSLPPFFYAAPKKLLGSAGML